MGWPTRFLQRLGQRGRERHLARFEADCRAPEEAQRRRLGEILTHLRPAERSRTLGLEPTLTAESFAQHAPLMTSADLEPWVRRSMQGERGLLSPEAPLYYVRTTGSTGEPKHVPLTRTYLREFQPVVHVALGHLYRRFPGAFTGRALYGVGSRHVDRAADGCDVGTMSGFTFTTLPALVQRLYGWPYPLFEVGHLPTRQFLALWLGVLAQPTFLTAIFPTSLVFLLRDLELRAPELATAARTGRMPGWLELTPEARTFFERALHRSATAARRFERAAAAPVEEKVREAFPELALCYCWTGATAALSIPELRRRLGAQVPVRDAVYSACEGFISAPLGDDEPGGVLAVGTHFYEFIEERDFERGERRTRFTWQLEDGGRYVVCFTHTAGLTRYCLGDVLEVYGRHHAAPKVRFLRKAGAAANLAGEKLEEVHATLAVSGALEALALEATGFCLVPRLDPSRLGYVLHLELSTPDAATDELAARVDALLCRHAFDYGRVRAAGHLAQVEVHLLPRGAFERWRQARVSAGAADAQLKATHLAADPAALAGLLSA